MTFSRQDFQIWPFFTIFGSKIEKSYKNWRLLRRCRLAFLGPLRGYFFSDLTTLGKGCKKNLIWFRGSINFFKLLEMVL